MQLTIGTVVDYHGSIRTQHGIRVVASGVDGRWNLADPAGGRTLTQVRTASFTATNKRRMVRADDGPRPVHAPASRRHPQPLPALPHPDFVDRPVEWLLARRRRHHQ